MGYYTDTEKLNSIAMDILKQSVKNFEFESKKPSGEMGAIREATLKQLKVKMEMVESVQIKYLKAIII